MLFPGVSGEELSILLPPEQSHYWDLEFKGLFGWDFCFQSELLREMNHSSISLAEHTWVLLKHMNAGEHRDWHVFLVSRASQIPCVPAGRLPWLPVTAALQQGDWHPDGCSGLGLQAGGCVCMGAAAGALGAEEHFCDVGEVVESGWRELLVLAKDAGWGLCTDTEIRVCSRCLDLDKLCLFQSCCQKPYLEILPLGIAKSS